MKAFAKLPQPFGFAIDYTDAALNLRSYYPDFVVLAEDGTHWLIETKGQETIDVLRKDSAAGHWCDVASNLTGTPWQYLKIPQKDFESLQPTKLAQLTVLQPLFVQKLGASAPGRDKG